MQLTCSCPSFELSELDLESDTNESELASLELLISDVAPFPLLCLGSISSDKEMKFTFLQHCKILHLILNQINFVTARQSKQFTVVKKLGLKT